MKQLTFSQENGARKGSNIIWKRWKNISSWYLYSDPAVAHASSPCSATPASSIGWATKGCSFWARADLPGGPRWNHQPGSCGTGLTDCYPFHHIPVIAFNSLQYMGVRHRESAGPGVRGSLDDVHPSFTVKASDYCVCPEGQGVLGRCWKMCTQMSEPGIASAIGPPVPGTSINYRHLSKATSLHTEKISRWKTKTKQNSESEEIWVEVGCRSDKLASSLFLKNLMKPSCPNHKYPQLCFVINWTFSMARLREALWNAQHQRPVFHFHQQTCLSSRTIDFCGTSQMLRVARA